MDRDGFLASMAIVTDAQLCDKASFASDVVFCHEAWLLVWKIDVGIVSPLHF